MTRTEIINALIDKHGYEDYLEIGVNTPSQPGYNWVGVKAQTKTGVDPNVDTTFKMTSDEFFEKMSQHYYDIVFVDGLHIFEQAYRDIVNSLKWLSPNGTIVVHDCNPVTEITQRRERASDAWHGDVWKAIVKLRMEEIGLTIHTVDTDEGCAIIRRGSQILLPVSSDEDPYDYSFLEKRRVEALNLISVEEFKKIYLDL
jgi:hypothetical protein